MKKLKYILISMVAAIAFVFMAVTGIKVNAATINTTYTLDCKTGSAVSSTDGYFTATKGSKSVSFSSSCTASFTSIIDGETYSSKKGIKMESATTITFTTTTTSTSTVTILWGANSAAATTIKFDSVESTSVTEANKTNAVSQTFSDVAAGKHTISVGTNQAVVFEVVVVESITVADGTYTVSYDINDHGESVDPALSVTALPNPLPSLSETGYTFGGWYYDDTTFENEATAGDAITDNTTLYAKWTVNSSEWCTITFDANGGSCDTASDTAVFASSYILPTATKSGYALGGWSDGTTTYKSTYTVPSSSAITLTAVWEELISFDEECSFTKGNNNVAGTSNSMFTVSGNVNTNSGMSYSYNGTTYTYPLKMESSTSLTFTTTNSGTLYIVFVETSGNAKLNGTKYTATNHVVKVEIEARDYTITKADTNNISFVGIIYDKIADDTTVSVYAEKNTTADTLRLVGTLTGISDISNIDTIELVLTLDNVATDSQIFLTTCYTSVTGTSQTCDAATGTYYVIYRINGISGAAGKTLSKKIIVTFTDGSTTTCDATTIDL